MDKEEEIEEVDVDVTNDNKEEKDELADNPEKLSRAISALSDREFAKVVKDIATDPSLSKDEKMVVLIDLHRHAKKEMQWRTIGTVLGLSHEGARKVSERAEKKLYKIMSKGKRTVDDWL